MEPGILTFFYKSRNVAGDDDLPLQGQWSHIKKTKRESSRTGSQWYCILVPRSVSEWWSHFWGEAIFEVGRRFLSNSRWRNTHTMYIFACFFFCKAWGESDLPKILFHGKSTPPPRGHVMPRTRFIVMWFLFQSDWWLWWLAPSKVCVLL